MVIRMCETGLKLAPILGDGMILQRNVNNRIYGTETLAKTVTVIFMEQEYTTEVISGEFYLEIPPAPAGGPYSMIIRGSSVIILSDIYLGDVYLLSGQSNMQLPVRRVLDISEDEISRTCEPQIRQYLIPDTYNFSQPEKYMPAGVWKRAAGEDLMDFSAAGYFFAKEIKEAYDIPIGLIMTAVGGSHIEAWMNPDTLQRFGDYEKTIQDFKDINYFSSYIGSQREEAGRWVLRLLEEEDSFTPEENYRRWNTCQVPSLVSDYGIGPFSGSIYLCKEVKLNSEPVEKDSYIYMGAMIDSDDLWMNGHHIGHTDYRYPPRKYQIPEGVLKQGINLVTVRIVINNQNGGTIKGKPYYIYYNGHKISLEGEWFYRIGKKADQAMPFVLYPPSLPVCFYNTVSVPLSKVSIKGVLWYQGESNTEETETYADKFAAMVSDWRKLYGWEVPVIYVQLANYREPLNTEEDTGWAELRDQQRLALSLGNTAMAAALDIGEAADVHPQNKKELGVRLAKAAQYLIYHEDVVPSGPLPLYAGTSGSCVIISFSYLENSEAEIRLNNFELAGSDGRYHKALAIRRGACVSVTSNEIAKPVFVRYAWCDSPSGINFYNGAGLPGPGFRLECQK